MPAVSSSTSNAAAAVTRGRDRIARAPGTTVQHAARGQTTAAARTSRVGDSGDDGGGGDRGETGGDTRDLTHGAPLWTWALARANRPSS